MIEEVNWLLNLRAVGQYEFEPVFNCFMIMNLKDDSMHLFLDSSSYKSLKKDAKIKKYLNSVKTTVYDITNF